MIKLVTCLRVPAPPQLLERGGHLQVCALHRSRTGTGTLRRGRGRGQGPGHPDFKLARRVTIR
eukprot:3341126-Rhodomonas_salina.1